MTSPGLEISHSNSMTFPGFPWLHEPCFHLKFSVFFFFPIWYKFLTEIFHWDNEHTNIKMPRRKYIWCTIHSSSVQGNEGHHTLLKGAFYLGVEKSQKFQGPFGPLILKNWGPSIFFPGQIWSFCYILYITYWNKPTFSRAIWELGLTFCGLSSNFEGDLRAHLILIPDFIPSLTWQIGGMLSIHDFRITG